MLQFYKMKGWVQWPLIRAHLCTLAVSVSLNSWWRAPVRALRYGGLPLALAVTIASALVLPLVLLQLAVGQLSQQDAVGVWRAVPFFKGVGYMRTLISLVGCVYTVVYAALTVTYFLHTLGSSIPFPECTALELTENGIKNKFNASECLESTFLAPAAQSPEYYISICLIILFIWIVLPFLLYSPVKFMKRIFYVSGPMLVILGLVVTTGIGSASRLSFIHDSADWRHFLQPDIWFGAVAHALISTQVAGGFLILAGDSIYSTTNVQWTAVAFVGANIASSWAGLLFWFAVSGDEATNTGPAAVLVQLYRAAEQQHLPVVWPLVVFAMLFLSGVITLLTFTYPVFDRIRRSSGERWRACCALASLGGAGASMATLALAPRGQVLTALEDYAVPLMAALATVIDTLALVIIYGWKTLMEDIEFLTGQTLSKFWMLGWCGAPGVIAPFTLWWLVGVVSGGAWLEPPWSASVVAATVAVAFGILVSFAAVAVARQVQYDIFAKLKSSFQPSRHWGPRDPITHYYWQTRREQVARGDSAQFPHIHRRSPGQFSGRPLSLHIANTHESKDHNSNVVKQRSHSDDWIYTVYRREYLKRAYSKYLGKNKRSASVGWENIPRASLKKTPLK